MKNFIKKLPGQWKFLAIVFIAYFIGFLINPIFIQEALVDFWATLKNIIPIILIVFLVMFSLNLFLKPEIIEKHLGHDSGLKGWAYAIIGSILISGPPYVLLPMFGDLKKQGMKTALIATFLSNRNVQPVFLPVMAYYFGIKYTIVVSFLIVIFSVISGNIIGKITREA